MPGAAVGRHIATRHRRALVVVGVVLVTAIGAVLVGSGGTLALWNTGAAVGAGTVKSGTSTLEVGILPPMYETVVGPGTSTVGAFSVSNTGSTALDMRVVTTTTKVSYAGSTPASTVLGTLTLHLSSVTSAAACTAGLTGASAPLATFDTGSGYYRLPVKTKAFACVELSLASDAPQSVSGAVVDFTLTVTGTQVAP